MTQTDDAAGMDDRGAILILGATGQQGGAVARALRARSRPVRAMVRNPASAAAKALSDRGVEVVRGDLDDAAALRSAVRGADGVFSVQPNSGNPGSEMTDADEVRMGKLVADQAVEAGVSHFVYASASVVGNGPTGIANLDCKLEIEAHIRALPVASTIVRPSTFMTLLARPDFWSDGEILTFFAAPDRPIELIAPDDIGKVVAMILDDRERFAGRAINIAGDTTTGAGIGAAISRALGLEVTYRVFPDEILAQSPALAKVVRLFDSGGATAHADMAALTTDFGPLTSLDKWLAGSGAAMVKGAVDACCR